MTTTTLLPHPKAVRELLADLLFRDVDVTPSQHLAPEADRPCTVAVYVDDRTHTGAVVVVDLELSAYAGAAIGLVPRGGAQAAVEDGELPPALADNLHEVLNVFAALFNVPGADHLRLYSVHGPNQAPPTDVSALVRSIGRRLDLAVAIGGYGTGRLAVVLA